MRRTRSHLSNLGNHVPHRAHSRSLGANGNAGQFAEDIQNRIDAIGGSHPTGSQATYGNQAPHNGQHHASWADGIPNSHFGRMQAANFHPPMHADYPDSIPPQQPAESAMDRVRMALIQMSNQLQAMGNRTENTPESRTNDPALLSHVNSIAKELLDLKAVVASALEKQPAKDEFAEIKSSVDAIGKRISRNGEHQREIDPNAYAHVVEASHEKLTSQINDIQQALAAGLGQPDVFAKTLEASHEELRSQIESLHQAFSVGRQEQISNERAADTLQQQIIEKLDQISSSIVASDVTNNSLGQDVIESRLEDINRAIIALSHNNSSIDQLERLEARISDVAKSLETGNGGLPGTDTETVLSRLDAIQSRIENLGVFSGDGGDVDHSALLARLDQLVNQIADISANSADIDALHQLSSQIADLDSRLEIIKAPAVQIGDSASGDIFARLEELASTISANIGSTSVGGDFVAFGEKLSGIEEQVASTRDISIEMAAQVAEDAVQRVINQLDRSPGGSGQFDPDSLRSLSDEIRQLNQSTAEANSEAAATFRSMSETLDQLVVRLDNFETAVATPSTDYEKAEHHHEEPLVEQTPLQIDQPLADTGDEIQEPPVSPHSGNNNRVAEYRALVNAPDKVEAPSVAQSLLEEARNAERLRNQSRQSPSVDDYHSFDTPGAAVEPAGALLSEKTEHSEKFADLPEEKAPSVAPEVTPELEIDETPIEPGSGGPDLAALVKQANDRRKSLAKNGDGGSGTDFIAAARRAAQAAAEEASAAHEEISQNEKSSKGGLLNSIPGLFSKRKKVVTLAAAATLLAALAVPLIGSQIMPVSNEHVASISGSKEAVSERSVSEVKVSPSAETELAEHDETAKAEDEFFSPVVEIQEDAGFAENETGEPDVDVVAELSFGNEALKNAVANEVPTAFHEIARRYTEGVGTEKSLEKAAIWFEKAAQLDHAPSQYMIANFSEKGVGVGRDLAAAANWYERAADNGNVVSMHNLAVLHATPNAVSPQPDMGSAFAWFKKAAEHGVRDSQVNLGIFYTKGVGTEVDLSEAYKWFTIAAKAGDSDAEAKRDVIAEALRPDQLEDAKSRIENWRPEEYNAVANKSDPNPDWLDQDTISPVALNRETVAKTQTLLSKIGYDAGPADGIIGKKTKEAIARFQQRVGLEVNGQITTELLRELEAIAI